MQKTIWDKYAQVLVDYSVDVQKGELVMITAQSFEAKDLVKAIYKRVLEKGAHPIVKTALGDLGEVFLKYASDEQLDYIDPIAKMEYETVDKFISLGAPLNTKNMARADLTKLSRRGKATKQLSEVLMKRSAEGTAKWVIADVPTNSGKR